MSSKISKSLFSLRDIPLLLIRLILAYGFYGPAMKKLGNPDAVASWFASMNYPLPTVSAYLAGITEFAGFILLALGFGTRIISAPLMFIMIVAIATVHWSAGFAASANGFEIPLYYFIMLSVLLVNGSGKISLDYAIKNIFCKKKASEGKLAGEAR